METWLETAHHCSCLEVTVEALLSISLLDVGLCPSPAYLGNFPGTGVQLSGGISSFSFGVPGPWSCWSPT